MRVLQAAAATPPTTPTGSLESPVIEVRKRPVYQFVKVKVPEDSACKLPPSTVLSPEMFFFGNVKPTYDELSLDQFMQGYTVLLSDER